MPDVLEPDQPAPLSNAAPSPSAVVAPSAPAPVPPPSGDEPATVDVGGVKHAPVAALVAERQRRQAAEDRAQQLESTLQQVQPLVSYVQQHPEVLQPPPAPGTPGPDPDVLEYAKLFSLYKPDGQLDLDTAGRALAIAEKRAAQKAEATVQPYAQANARDRSLVNFQRASQLKDASGTSPSQQSLRAIWQNLPAEYTADPGVSSLLAAMAIGLDRLATVPPPVPPTHEPVVSEPSGGPGHGRVALSALEEAIAVQRRLTPEKWADLTKGHVKGRPMILEDD